eukprot:4627786-Amphidinium_carterae.1
MIVISCRLFSQLSYSGWGVGWGCGLSPLVDSCSHVCAGTIYSGFTFVLGFILVFRTSQSYTRSDLSPESRCPWEDLHPECFIH